MGPSPTALLIDPAEQLLPRSYRSALSQLHSIHCSRFQSYHHSVVWADDPTCPDCRSTDHMVAHLLGLSCPSHSTDLVHGDMWTAPLQVSQFLAGLPQFSDLPPLQIDSTPSLSTPLAKFARSQKFEKKISSFYNFFFDVLDASRAIFIVV